MKAINTICVIIMAIQIAACGPKPAPAPDDLVVSIGGESAEGYDPTLGWGRYGNTLFYSTLLKLNEKLTIVNDLAASYATSPDGLTWTVTIRNDAKFTDGKELTPKDVAYTFNKARDSGGKVDLTMLDKAVATGNSTVQFRLKRPYVAFINKLLTLGIVPEHAHRNNRNFARNPVGSGPYKFTSWSEGQQLIVEANPFYYGKKPAIKRIVFLFMSEDTGYAAAKSGVVHMVFLSPLMAKRTFKNMKIHPVKTVDNRGIVFPCVPETGKKTAAGHPIGNDVTSDAAIRKAVNYAIDRTLIAKTILEGHGEPAYGMVDGLPWDEHAIRIRDNDIGRARQILAEAGWKDTDGDGIAEKNGVKAEFDLVYYANDALRQQLALACSDMASRAGIKMNVIGKNSEEIIRLHHSCAVLYGFGSHSPEEMYNLHHSKFAGIETYNVGLYSNKTVDAYLDRAMSSSSFSESLKYWRLAQWDGKTGLSARGDATWAWIVNIPHIYFISDSLDVGTSMIEPHGGGWPITANIVEWKWKRNTSNKTN